MQGDRTERVVLVVEDDRDCLDAVCELLRFEGYRTVAATSGREALDYLRGPPATSGSPSTSRRC